ncbi:hypothetical protein MUB24_04165 [Lederbergia sp. NSJ-179]|uniref:hypothetical protein n=1 Tax=Lederbergia sp. NSJ-179 TaxID=2931402 RepID=UPI001FD29B0D|nr:hypothetical protein [Lederbergia sp. NSJ-179]MCJ7840119.1 hypothetical protein [Lederbergia sp. NSJ-179]
MSKFLWLIILLVLPIYGCGNNEVSNGTSASFAYEKSIVFNGNLYVGQDEEVNKIERKIGVINYYSDKEEEYSNKDNSSNYYDSGTNIYEISGMDISKAIAIEISNGHYIKAINEEEIK